MKNKDLVKYNNDFNIANLGDLTKIESDIFMTICSKFSKLKTEKIELTYDELKSSAKLINRKYTYKKCLDFIISTQSKLLKINFSIFDGENFIQAPIFKYFATPKNGDKVSVQLNDIFTNYLYDIPQKISFSQFELDSFLQLKSKYSKTLLRFFLQNYKGFWEVNYDDFKLKLSFPSSQISSQIFRTLDKCIAELEKTDVISNISYTLEKARTKGSPITKVKFTYKISNKIKEEIANIDTLPTNTTVLTEREIYNVIPPSDPDDPNSIYSPAWELKKEKKSVPKLCPKCGAEVLSSKDKNGNEYHYCKNNAYWKIGNKSCDWREYQNKN